MRGSAVTGPRRLKQLRPRTLTSLSNLSNVKYEKKGKTASFSNPSGLPKDCENYETYVCLYASCLHSCFGRHLFPGQGITEIKWD